MRDKMAFNNTKITNVPEDFFGFGLTADQSLAMGGNLKAKGLGDGKRRRVKPSPILRKAPEGCCG
jgi:hypothetical protein